MTNKTQTKADFSEFDGRVGQAWSLHIRKRYDEAIQSYRDLLKEWPDHIDALFGLGLTYKMSGQKERAVEYFTKARQNTEAELSKAPAEPARFHMLLRIIDQHLSSLK